jgi:hypothetical protein
LSGLALLLLLAGATAGIGETPFEPGADSFRTAAECKARLAAIADEARRGAFDAIEGPYDVASGDVRVHIVAAEGKGHRIAEHRCLAEKLSSRSWAHRMEEDLPEFSVDSVARSSAWLKQGAAQKQ